MTIVIIIPFPFHQDTPMTNTKTPVHVIAVFFPFSVIMQLFNKFKLKYGPCYILSKKFT